MFCQKCGKELVENAMFCSGCGEKTKNILNVNTAAEIPNVSNAKKKMNKKKTKVLLIIAIIIAFFIIVASIGSEDGSFEQLQNGDFNFDSDAETTTNNDAVFNENLSIEEKLEILETTASIRDIADFWTVCPEENKSDLTGIFERRFMQYLTENRSKIYSHNMKFVENLNEILGNIDSSVFLAEKDIHKILLTIEKLCAKSEDYNKYTDAMNISRGCIEVEGEIIKRIGDSSNEGDYLDEYMLEYYGAYDDWAELIIYSENSLQPGLFSGYLKYKDTKEYVSDGFEYTFDVYTIMSDREIERYFEADEIILDLMSVSVDVNTYFEEFCEIVDEYAKKYPALITDDNYLADYVGGYKDFPYEYLHKLTLNADNTFDLSVNMYEGFSEYSGTFKKEGNLIICENDDVYFELVISGENLVYHNRMEYSSNTLEDGTLFIR